MKPNSWIDIKQHPSVNVERIFNELDRIAGYKDDWDFEGALAVSSSAINQVKAFIVELSKGYTWSIPHVAALSDGGIRLLWNRGGVTGRVIAYGINPTLDIFIDRPGEIPAQYSGLTDKLALLSVISE